ncbi:MAG: stage II sporulation protein P, partial [Christensenellaceae bacterium]|nr:stage II sporulation protein P [Christensenellaceae bacterium]
YAFASSVTNELNDIHPDLATDVRVKVGRHNQHVGLCLLAEVGHNANTLSDVINTLPHFADALKSVCEFKESK